MKKLAGFRANSRLQQATLQYIASNLTAGQQIEELRKAFIALDKNGDGHLTVSELKVGYENISLSSSVKIDEILNIISVVEIIEDTTKLNIVTEICTGGELFDRILNSQPFTENSAANFMYQILSGLIHIHSSGFIHRDLKPENILFLNNKPDSSLKIIDFGVSKRITSNSKLTRFIGTVFYS